MPNQYKAGHGHYRNRYGSRTYESWRTMNQRCNNKRATEYHRYGGRGIRVCDRWRHSFANFLADMGERPPNTTLDRFFDPDGDYSPDNCVWSTYSVQQSALSRQSKLRAMREKLDNLSSRLERIKQ